MRRFTLVTANSLLIGIVLGVVARLTMRLISIVEGAEAEFTWGATAGIVTFFVLAALGGGWGGMLSGHPRIGLAMAVVATTPIALLGIAIGGGDLIESIDDQSAGVFALIALGALVIAACVVASPIISWRRARSSEGLNFTGARVR